MRRVRHLQYCDYIVSVKQKAGRGICLSDSIMLERTWHERRRKIPRTIIHARFNANTMNGLQLLAYLSKDNHPLQSVIAGGDLYRVNLDDWSTTLIMPLTFSTAANGQHTALVTQAQLGANELTGMECYMVEARLLRVRRHYGARVWLNHLGCFDSINELRRTNERLEILKVD